MEKQFVADSEIKLLAAIKNADTVILDQLLHEDLLFNLPTGQTITKSDDMQTYRSGNMRVESLEASGAGDQYHRRYSCSCCYHRA